MSSRAYPSPSNIQYLGQRPEKALAPGAYTRRFLGTFNKSVYDPGLGKLKVEYSGIVTIPAITTGLDQYGNVTLSAIATGLTQTNVIPSSATSAYGGATSNTPTVIAQSGQRQSNAPDLPLVIPRGFTIMGYGIRFPRHSDPSAGGNMPYFIQGPDPTNPNSPPGISGYVIAGLRDIFNIELVSIADGANSTANPNYPLLSSSASGQSVIAGCAVYQVGNSVIPDRIYVPPTGSAGSSLWPVNGAVIGGGFGYIPPNDYNFVSRPFGQPDTNWAVSTIPAWDTTTLDTQVGLGISSVGANITPLAIGSATGAVIPTPATTGSTAQTNTTLPGLMACPAPSTPYILSDIFTSTTSGVTATAVRSTKGVQVYQPGLAASIGANQATDDAKRTAAVKLIISVYGYFDCPPPEYDLTPGING